MGSVFFFFFLLNGTSRGNMAAPWTFIMGSCGNPKVAGLFIITLIMYWSMALTNIYRHFEEISDQPDNIILVIISHNKSSND